MFGLKKSKDNNDKNEWFDVWPKGEAANNMGESLNRLIKVAEEKDMDVAVTLVQGSRFVHISSSEEKVSSLVNELGSDSYSFRESDKSRIPTYKAALKERKK